MKDVLGRPLSVGDFVVFIANATDSPSLKTGKVTKIYANDEECSINRRPHIQSQRVMKLTDGVITLPNSENYVPASNSEN